MDRCDVLIAGGGPAGSACAWKLRRSGVDALIADKAEFPRDKVCAGWITPQVLADLEIDPDEYRTSRVFQPITGFRIGLIGEDRVVDVDYAGPVSFGIRRCEFDEFLLRRSGARLRLGVPVTTARRDNARWIVNDSIEASMLVGAGGHFCPVARMINGAAVSAPLIAAQEVEFAIPPGDRGTFATDPERPELYFCRDLRGYGWCFRKGSHLNVGFGSLDTHGLPKATAGFVAFLQAQRRIPADASWRWKGHAYLLSSPDRRRVLSDGVLLVGDAAGLAYPQSGEGIRPAIESGLMAASAIIDADGRYECGALAQYEVALQRRFDGAAAAHALSRVVPAGLPARLAPWLLGMPWFVRRVLLDRWFLHAQEPALSAS